MSDKLKKFDVSQVMLQFDGKPFPSDGTPPTLKTCLGIILNGDTTDLPTTEQGEVFTAGVKVALAEKNVELKQSEYNVVKKICDKPRPCNHPFINQTSVCVQIRNMIDAAVQCEDFAATG